MTNACVCVGGGSYNWLMLIIPSEMDTLWDPFKVKCRKRKKSLIFKTVLLKWPKETIFTLAPYFETVKWLS